MLGQCAHVRGLACNFCGSLLGSRYYSFDYRMLGVVERIRVLLVLISLAASLSFLWWPWLLALQLEAISWALDSFIMHPPGNFDFVWFPMPTLCQSSTKSSFIPIISSFINIVLLCLLHFCVPHLLTDIVERSWIEIWFHVCVRIIRYTSFHWWRLFFSLLILQPEQLLFHLVFLLLLKVISELTDV